MKMKRFTQKVLTLGLIAGAVSGAAIAADGVSGPQTGDREFSLSGTGSSDKDGDNSNFGVTGDLGWYTSSRMVWGVRQSLNFADIEGEDVKNDYWNGSTRLYTDYHFGSAQARPFVGASLGAIYGDGVNDTGFAGLELGMKYYVLENTYILGRGEYQFFFDNGNDVDDNFSDGAWAYTVGIGYNF